MAEKHPQKANLSLLPLQEVPSLLEGGIVSPCLSRVSRRPTSPDAGTPSFPCSSSPCVWLSPRQSALLTFFISEICRGFTPGDKDAELLRVTTLRLPLPVCCQV